MLRGIVPFLFLAAAAGGCQKMASKSTGKPGTTSAAKEEPAADDPPGMTRWTDSQIEQTVREDMKFTSLILKKESRDRYTGTGQDATGKAYTVVVRYRPGEIRIDAEAVVQPPGGHDRKSYHWNAENVTPKWKESGK